MGYGNGNFWVTVRVSLLRKWMASLFYYSRTDFGRHVCNGIYLCHGCIATEWYRTKCTLGTKLVAVILGNRCNYMHITIYIKGFRWENSPGTYILFNFNHPIWLYEACSWRENIAQWLWAQTRFSLRMKVYKKHPMTEAILMQVKNDTSNRHILWTLLYSPHVSSNTARESIASTQ